MKLSEMAAGSRGQIVSVGGSPEFQRRITAVGITPGGGFSIVKNDKKYPVQLKVRSTVLAVDRKDCENIQAEVIANG